MRALWVIAVVAACGRVNFEPLGGDADSGSDGGGLSSGAGDCASPIKLQVGVPYTGDIADAGDDYASFGCPNGVEMVFQLDAPTAGQHTIRIQAQFLGGTTVTSRCPAMIGSCQGFSAGTVADNIGPLQAGVNYIILEKFGTQGTTFTLTVL